MLRRGMHILQVFSNAAFYFDAQISQMFIRAIYKVTDLSFWEEGWTVSVDK